MYGTVKLRSRNANSNNNSTYMRRPQSWGEFQSKLLQRVTAPVAGAKADPSVADKSVEEYQSTNTTCAQPPSPNKSRPVSESSLQTPFYKPFRPFGQRQSTSELDLSVFSSNLPAPVAVCLPEKETEDFDAPSLAFEEALGAQPAERESESATVAVEPDRHADSASPRDSAFADQGRNAKPPPEGTLQVTASRLSDSAYECASEASERSLTLSSDGGLTANAAQQATSDGDSSDVSSIVDTGFYSVDEKEISLGSPDRLDQRHADSEEMSDGKVPAAAPRKSRTSSGIPKSLRSCYNHSYVIDNGDLSSKSSVDYTDDDVASEMQMNGGTTQKQNSKQQASGLPVPVRRASSEQPKKRASTSSESSFRSESDTSGSQPSVRKGILRKPKTEQQKSQATAQPKAPTKEIGWKDDQIVNVGVHYSSKPTEQGNGVATHGTWPRRLQKSRRKQDQEEAEELLRRFRETSDSYRNKFRDVFAETRRKMEEAVFGLRVTMAKNGYNARCYQPKFAATASLPRDATA